MPKESAELSTAETNLLTLMALVIHLGGMATISRQDILTAVTSESFEVTEGPDGTFILVVRRGDTALELAKDST